MDGGLIDTVRQRIAAGLPGAEVHVRSFGGHDHLQATVAAPQFAGKTTLEQHRMVYACLAGLIGGPVHALALETRARATGREEART